MTKEFAPYELAVKLEALGFNEPCFAYYRIFDGYPKEYTFGYFDEPKRYESNIMVFAPTFSQAFRWFREKYGLCIVIKPIDDKKLELGYNLLKNGLMMGSHLTYEEAELDCLTKLIEIVQGGQDNE